MKLSIALCTYNGARFVEEQLQSIAAQTRRPDELVICDDRSGDDTPAMLARFAAAAPFPVRIHTNEINLGVVKNFEQAIGMCNGEIIALCDQDDVWHPAKLARLEQTLAAAPNVGLVFTDAEIIDESSRPLGWRLWQGARFTELKQRLVTEGYAFDVLAQQNVVTGATMAFRAKYVNLALPIESAASHLIHDAWIALLISVVADLAIVSDPLINYRIHPHQQMGIEHPSRHFTTNTVHRYYMQEIEKLETLCLMLARLKDRLEANDYARSLAEKTARVRGLIAHYHVRGNIPRKRLNRVPFVLKEVASLRYHKYSKGWSSAMKDILRPDIKAPMTHSSPFTSAKSD